MEVFKTFLFFGGFEEGQPQLADTIFFEGEWWLVASWLESNDTGQRIPERLVRLTGLQHQEVQGEEFRFLLNNALPISVYRGEEQEGYVIRNHPASLSAPGPSSIH